MRRLLVIWIFALSFVLPVALPTAAFQGSVPQEQKKTQTVYITRTGKRYHRDGCRYLAYSKIPVSLEEAKKNRYTPCPSHCGTLCNFLCMAFHPLPG
jgi:biopolymer transport protein ExbD